jgi:DNA-directed RNA polymerase specialized sigma24 family protein
MCSEPDDGQTAGAQASAEDAALARIVRREAGLIVAQLQRRLGNFDIAGEAVREAIIIALRTWRRDGAPANPGGWLSLAARRRAIDLLRKRSRELPLADEWDADITAADAVESTGDERLPMLFGCCHPALSVEARLALTLRAVVGMTTPEIASASLQPWRSGWYVPSARSPARIPFTIPATADLAPRLDDGLTVIYLSYNAGYLEPSESGRELSDDAIWLAELVAAHSRIRPRHGGCWHYSLSSTREPRLDLMSMIGWCCWKIKIVVAGTEWQSVAPTATCRRRLPFADRVDSSYRPRSAAAMQTLHPGLKPIGCRSLSFTTFCSVTTLPR